MKLDVGCGTVPRGDINCDVWIKPNNPHIYKAKTEMNVKDIKNFVRCDANNLPFRDKTFTETTCFHVIEHEGVNPIKVLKELTRVTSGIITIKTPHRYWRYKRFQWRHFQSPLHDKLFSVKSMQQLLKKCGLNAKIFVKTKPLLSRFFPVIQLPEELIVTIPIK